MYFKNKSKWKLFVTTWLVNVRLFLRNILDSPCMDRKQIHWATHRAGYMKVWIPAIAQTFVFGQRVIYLLFEHFHQVCKCIWYVWNIFTCIKQTNVCIVKHTCKTCISGFSCALVHLIYYDWYFILFSKTMLKPILL